MADYDEISVTKESLWYIDNYGKHCRGGLSFLPLYY